MNVYDPFENAPRLTRRGRVLFLALMLVIGVFVNLNVYGKAQAEAEIDVVPGAAPTQMFGSYIT